MNRYVVARRSRYIREELFDLVADVESYPEFVPYIVGTRVDRAATPQVRVEMLLAFGLLRRRIRSVGPFASFPDRYCERGCAVQILQLALAI